MTGTGAVLSVVTGDNADLIAHIQPLFIPDGAYVRDVTWGKGAFWRKADLTRITLQGSDIGTKIGGRKGWDGHDVWTADFTSLPDTDASVDVVVLDPPYIHNPGAHSTDARYNNVTTTGGFYHRDIRELYIDGMREAKRVLKDGGTLLVKCKDQVESGIQCWAHVEMLLDAEELGLHGRDLFVLVPTSRTSTNRWTTQKHSRKIHSFLWVFDKPENPSKYKRSAVTDRITQKDTVEKTALDKAVDGLAGAMSEVVREVVAETLNTRGLLKPAAKTAVKSTTAVPARESAKIRAWLTEQGYAVKPSGRIPDALMDAYRSKHPVTP